MPIENENALVPDVRVSGLRDEILLHFGDIDFVFLDFT